MSEQPTISIIIPTRSRGKYLYHTLSSCVNVEYVNLEIVVLDNASDDDTFKIVESFCDERIRYHRNDKLLSMRNNWERAFGFSSGEIICFLGDDDSILPDAVDRVVNYFDKFNVDAVMSSQARYYWPDTPSTRRNCGLLPIISGYTIQNSKDQLHKLLRDGRYQRLPCAYYGFVKRSVYDAIIKKQGRFFVSNMTDVYSAVALSFEGIPYLFTERPLTVAGVSGKSNGGRADSQSSRQLYLDEWKKEDDVGFLPGFEGWRTIRSVVVEQGIHYCISNEGVELGSVFDMTDVENVLAIESAQRKKQNQPDSEIELMYTTAGLEYKTDRFAFLGYAISCAKILKYHTLTFFSCVPIIFDLNAVDNVNAATKHMVNVLESKKSKLRKISNRFVAMLRFM